MKQGGLNQAFQAFVAHLVDKSFEQICQERTAFAWLNALDEGAEFFERERAVYQECDFCHKSYGLFFIWFTEEGKARCIHCETVHIFTPPPKFSSPPNSI